MHVRADSLVSLRITMVMVGISSIAPTEIVTIISVTNTVLEKIFAMTTRHETRRARESLDRRTADLRPLSKYAVPHRGWVRAIRDALGMSAADLGRRMGISGASVRSIEQKELSGGVRLGTLRRAAEAMDCTLVYAIVPNQSLEAIVRRQARNVLDPQWRHVQQSMALEDQAAEMTEADREEQIRSVLDSRRLWSRWEDVE